ALENTPDVDAGLPIVVAAAASVSHQAAGKRELARIIARGNRVAGGQSHDLIAVKAEERVIGHEQGGVSAPDETRERGADLAFAAGAQDIDLLTDGARGGLHVVEVAVGIRIVRIAAN